MFLTQYFTVALVAALALAEPIQLASTQGILIPAPFAQRMARSAYGGYTGPAPFQASSSSSSASAGASAAAGSAPGSGSYGAPAYNAPSVPSPPCPRNYLFSCAPSLTPVPCAAPAPSYGSAPSYGTPSYGPSTGSSHAHVSAANPQGAYSEFISQYVRPSFAGY